MLKSQESTVAFLDSFDSLRALLHSMLSGPLRFLFSLVQLNIKLVPV